MFVWDPSYVDTPVMTKRDSDGNGTLDQAVYYVFDALRNITAMVVSGGNVGERYHYESHGGVTIMSGNWGVRASSIYDNNYLFNGRERDKESGLYYFRARYLDPSLGRFMNRDPLGLVDGMNLYNSYFIPNGLDPSGLRVARLQGEGGQAFVQPEGQRMKDRDFIDHLADLGVGWGSVPTMGANRWLLTDDNSIDDQSIYYKGGTGLGIATSIALGGIAGTGKLGAGWALGTAQTHLLASTGFGTYEATTNLINHRATAWDALAFTDVVGFGLGRAFRFLKPILGGGKTKLLIDDAGLAPDFRTGVGYGVNDPPVRIQGTWTAADYERALQGSPPPSLGRPDIHHAGQMPGSPIHEIIPGQHRGNPALHPNVYNQGVTRQMRMQDRQLHWWYRAREEGADKLFPELIYDD